MKAFRKIILSLTLAIAIVMPSLSFEVSAATYVANWGERGVVATALSDSAVAFYEKYGVEYSELSQKAGSTNTSSITPTDASTTELYRALQSVMETAHTTTTSYDGTRSLFKYTDCSNGKTANITCFYSGKTLSSTWDSGATWNREHSWPKSKTSDKDGKSPPMADIMMLRPTASNVNSGRGNKAYGESSGYYDPLDETMVTDVNVRGDAARIVLYVYTRWDVNQYALDLWGTDGVFENRDILLKWIQEDPVDTWEMGRNDAVQSITGTRNIFVDYPEYAFLLFGKEIPAGMQTPSGGANATPCEHEKVVNVAAKEPTCTEAGNTAGVKCATCGAFINNTTTIPALGHSYDDGVITTEPQCAKAGVKTFTCKNCGGTKTEAIKALGHSFENGACTVCGAEEGALNEEGVVFEFGNNGAAAHKDGSSATTYTETVGDFTLSITNGSKVYKGATDAKGNSCLKLGTGDVVGSFTFTVPDEVQSVVIKVAQYKANTTKITVNGVNYTITTASNNGEYTDITVDTSATKTVNFATTSSGKRCMINSITYYATVTSGGNTPGGGDTPVDPEIAELLAKDTLTIAEVIKVAGSLADGGETSKKYYVTGTVAEISSADFGDMYIKSGNDTLLIYGTYNADGTVGYKDMQTKPVAGDTVKLYATIKNYQGTPELYHAWIVEHIPGSGQGGEETDPEIAELLAKDTLTIAEAIKVANSLADGGETSKKYYVTGTVTEISSADFGDMYIKSGNDTLLVYGTYNADGTVGYKDMQTKPVVGDTVKLYATIKNYQGTPELYHAWIVEIIDVEEPCNHAKTEVIPAVEATCTEAGLTEGLKCADCGQIITSQQEVSATGHSFKEGTCGVCGAKDPSYNPGDETPCNHAYGEWVVTKEATTEEAGERTRTCSKCGETQTESIAKLENKPAQPNCNASIDFGSIGLIAMAVAGVIIDRKRRK